MYYELVTDTHLWI